MFLNECEDEGAGIIEKKLGACRNVGLGIIEKWLGH